MVPFGALLDYGGGPHCWQRGWLKKLDFTMNQMGLCYTTVTSSSGVAKI